MWGIVLTLGLAGSGCGAPSTPPAQVAPGEGGSREGELSAQGAGPASPPGPDTLRLDGVVIHSEVDPLTQLHTYDAEELFQMAREMARTDQVERGIAVYQRLLEHFADSPLVHPALYNQGLLYERKERWQDAADAYFTLADEALPVDPQARRTWLDAHYRLAVCFGKMSHWWRAVEIFDRVLEHDWLDDPSRLEAMVGRGIAIQEAGEPDSAETAFAAVLSFARRAQREGFYDDKGMVAEAAFRMGDISRDRYEKVQLVFPVELLRERLETKCQHLLEAQNRYLRAIRHGDAHTVAAAGYRIGSLYEELYTLMLSLDAPAELDDEQRTVYRDEVKGRIRILVAKALKIYERALLTGRRAQTAADWNRKLEDSIRRLRDHYLKDTPLPSSAEAAEGQRPVPQTGGNADGDSGA